MRTYFRLVVLNLVGFFGFLFFCVAVNFVAAQLNTNCGPLAMFHCADAVQRVGFPLVFAELGGPPMPPGTSRPGGSLGALLFDVSLGLVGSVIAGATCQYYFGRAKAEVPQ